jgi:hypothetical protein
MYFTPNGVATRFKYAPAYLSLVRFLLASKEMNASAAAWIAGNKTIHETHK